MKQFWSVFPDWFLENFTGVRIIFETFLCQRIRYVHMLESYGTGMKAQASSPNKEFEEGQ